jgi:hypothetical protein
MSSIFRISIEIQFKRVFSIFFCIFILYVARGSKWYSFTSNV